jgi:plexin B
MGWVQVTSEHSPCREGAVLKFPGTVSPVSVVLGESWAIAPITLVYLCLGGASWCCCSPIPYQYLSPYQVTMPVLGPALLQVLWAGWVFTLQLPPPAAFIPNGTYLQHLARDPTSGTLYVGATNFLFQLSPGLQLEATVSTGPVNDSRDCLPPVMPDECPQARPTSNPNQLLLVSPGALVVCGSVYQGVCELRSLEQLEQLLLRPERPGDTQYVAANDPAVSTVGLVAQDSTGDPLLFVGRGYTSRGVGGGIPPITTRALRPLDPQAAFSYEETAKLAVGRLSEYSHHFVSAFTRGANVYFLFLRRDLASSRAFHAYVSRVCLRDQHYYSYVELPLDCQGGRYGLIQATAVAMSREVAQGEVLFAAFSTVAPPTVDWPLSVASRASGTSVLCAFPLDEVDRLANYTRDACYTRGGCTENGTKVAYIAYDVLSGCAQLPVVSSGMALAFAPSLRPLLRHLQPSICSGSLK